jgi:outer membrane protein W
MKRYIILQVILIFCPASLFAQFEKGKNAIGLSLGLGYDNNGNVNKSTASNWDYTIAPNLTYEYFFHRNLSLIAGVEASFWHNKVIQDHINSNQQFYRETILRNQQSISPLLGIKKYFFNETGKFGIFVAPYTMLNYRVTSTRTTSNNPQTSPNANSSFYSKEDWLAYLNANIGFCYFIRPNFSLELNAQVMQGTMTTKYQRFWLGPDLGNIKYGVRYYF